MVVVVDLNTLSLGGSGFVICIFVGFNYYFGFWESRVVLRGIVCLERNGSKCWVVLFI